LKAAVRSRRVDDLAHGPWLSYDKLLDDARGDPGHAIGLAAAVTEGELVEIDLQVLRACLESS
jgi:hypothetical protein